MPRQIKNSTLLMKVIKDPRFVAGVNKAIKVTQRTGYESKFTLDRVEDSSRMIYPCDISLGDEKSAGLKVGQKRINKIFTEQYGRAHGLLTEDREYSRFLIELFEKEKANFVRYPIAKDDPDGFENALLDVDNDELCERFIDSLKNFLMFHTHPSQNPYPSKNDFLYCRAKEEIGLVVAAESAALDGKRHKFTIYQGDPLISGEFQMAQVFGTQIVGNTKLASGVYIADTGKFKFHQCFGEGARRVCAAKEVLKVFDNLS